MFESLSVFLSLFFRCAVVSMLSFMPNQFSNYGKNTHPRRNETLKRLCSAFSFLMPLMVYIHFSLCLALFFSFFFLQSSCLSRTTLFAFSNNNIIIAINWIYIYVSLLWAHAEALPLFTFGPNTFCSNAHCTVEVGNEGKRHSEIIIMSSFLLSFYLFSHDSEAKLERKWSPHYTKVW